MISISMSASFSSFLVGVVYVTVGALAHAQLCICRAESTLDMFSSFSVLFQIFYRFMYICMSDGVCTCECTCLQRTKEATGSLGTGVLSSFELPSMGSWSQTQFLWKNKSSHSLRHWPGFFHLEFWDRVSHWTWSLSFFQQAPRFCAHQCWGYRCNPPPGFYGGWVWTQVFMPAL